MFEIYKITNSLDGKVYIGLTSKTADMRFGQHCKHSGRDLRYAPKRFKRPSTVQRAIRVYGEQNFSLEVIDRAESREEAWQKERYWIRVYKSNDRRFGYNRTRGGDGVLRNHQQRPEDI